MRSAVLLREARLRAGLTQEEVGKRVGSPQSVIARWETGRVRPSLETLSEVVRACGFDLSAGIRPADPSEASQIERNLKLGPRERLEQLVRAVRFIERGRTKLKRGR